MPDLQALLDQIDRLDQQATPGQWDHTVEWAEIGSGPDSVIHGYGYAHCDVCDEETEGVDARVALSPQDAEFIALARTFAPASSRALRDVLETLDQYIVKFDQDNMEDHIVHCIVHELRNKIYDQFREQK